MEYVQKYVCMSVCTRLRIADLAEMKLKKEGGKVSEHSHFPPKRHRVTCCPLSRLLPPPQT